MNAEIFPVAKGLVKKDHVSYSELSSLKMDHSNSMETTGQALLNSEPKQTPLTEAIEGIKLTADSDIKSYDSPVEEAVAEKMSINDAIYAQPINAFTKTHNLIDSEMDTDLKDGKYKKNSMTDNMEVNQKTDNSLVLANISSSNNETESVEGEILRKEIFGGLNNTDSVNDKKISFSDIKIPESDKCISSRSGRAVRTRYPKQLNTNEFLIKPIRGQKRKAEVNIEELYTQDRIGDVKCTPLETISEGVEWECGMTKKRRLCQFNSAAVSYDPIPYSPSRAKVRMQKKRAKELGVKVCQGRRVSIEDVKGLLDSISGDEEEQMIEEKSG